MVRQGTRQSLEAHADLEIIGEAVDGEETLRLARTLRPDILLLDISMPQLNGIEVTRAIREELPVVRTWTTMSRGKLNRPAVAILWPSGLASAGMTAAPSDKQGHFHTWVADGPTIRASGWSGRSYRARSP